MTARHYFAFETRHSGAYWCEADGSTSLSGSLHRFTTHDERDAWVAAGATDPQQTRTAETTRDLPHGHAVYGPGAGYYDGAGTEASRWRTWCLNSERVR